MKELALFGGESTFPTPLHVGCPNLGNQSALFERLERILSRRWLTNDGKFVREFEYTVASLLGVRNCVAICNGTIALEIAIKACQLSGEVIVPSFTFVATAHALQWLGIRPVFCDIDRRTHNIDPVRVEELITPNTSGIIGVHLWGRPCETGRLEAIARKRGLRLLFDSAHSFGCSHGGRMIGNFGDAEVLSFHATKFVNSFEGGAIVTNDDEIAHKARLLRNFGFTGYDRVELVGTNGKMSEISAAMGLTSMESLDDFLRVNRINHNTYREGLSGLAGISVIPYDESERNNYQCVVLEVDESECAITRDDLMEALWAENVLARRYFYPGCHRMEPYRTLFPEASQSLCETERLVSRVLCLPTGSCVRVEDIEKINALIKRILGSATSIQDRLAHLRYQKCDEPKSATSALPSSCHGDS